MSFYVLYACTNLTSPQFGGGGERYATGDAGLGAGSSGGGGYETGDTGGETGDTGVKVEEGAPVLGGVTMVMAADAYGGAYVLGTVAYADDEGDVVGGRLYVDWSGATDGSSPGAATLTIGSSADTSGAQYAYAGATSISFYVSNLYATLDYAFLLQAVDASGYTSNVASGTVGPL